MDKNLPLDTLIAQMLVESRNQPKPKRQAKRKIIDDLVVPDMPPVIWHPVRLVLIETLTVCRCGHKSFTSLGIYLESHSSRQHCTKQELLDINLISQYPHLPVGRQVLERTDVPYCAECYQSLPNILLLEDDS